MANNSKTFWDKAWTRENDRFYMHFYSILDQLPDEGKIIDIGCGTGTLLRFIKKNKPKLKLEGRDISSVAIGKLKKSGIKGKVEKLPIITGKADIIIATEVLEHMKDDMKVFKKMSEVSNKIIITVPNNRLGPEECNEHERLYTAESLGDKLDKYFNKYTIFEADGYLLAIAWNK